MCRSLIFYHSFPCIARACVYFLLCVGRNMQKLCIILEYADGDSLQDSYKLLSPTLLANILWGIHNLSHPVSLSLPPSLSLSLLILSIPVISPSLCLFSLSLSLSLLSVSFSLSLSSLFFL